MLQSYVKTYGLEVCGMKEIVLDFEQLVSIHDEEVSPIVEQIIENRNRGDSFDPQLEEDLIKCLEEMLEKRILQWETEMQEEIDLENIDLEEVLTYNIPKELADDLDSLAMEQIDLEEYMIKKDSDIWAKLEALDTPQVQDVHEKILTISINENDIDFEPELKMAV